MNEKIHLPYPFEYQRRNTRGVKVGNVEIGGNNPIRIQSMLSSLNTDIDACVEEIRKLDHAGCELIRLTVPTRKELDAIFKIKDRIRSEGIKRPLVADIHFSPQLAMEACELFEKIRINPGNFSDSPKNKTGHSSEENFQEGFERLKETVQPFIIKLKEYKRALRIGVNQGSLSTRMIEKYGDSPRGMVASAIEAIDLFEKEDFMDIIVSLKSSNPLVVQQAYRLLALQLPAEKAVPFHLGVTEAGDDLMGRIKSAAGMGPLLMDGLGDTIRVSLTEPSENEILVAENIIKSVEEKKPQWSHKGQRFQLLGMHREQNADVNLNGCKIGNGNPVKLGIPLGTSKQWESTDLESDFFYKIQIEQIQLKNEIFKLRVLEDETSFPDVEHTEVILLGKSLSLHKTRKMYLDSSMENRIVAFEMPAFDEIEPEDYRIDIELAGILGEGLIDLVLLPEKADASSLTRFLSLLQATRSRLFSADYISCPSCGRTLFDLQSTVGKIKEKTSHLKGVKIGIMGCVVNGPGEMADADVGYVGSGPGKIDLYLGQQRVKRSIPEDKAVGALVDLLKEQGMWRDRE